MLMKPVRGVGRKSSHWLARSIPTSFLAASKVQCCHVGSVIEHCSTIDVGPESNLVHAFAGGQAVGQFKH